jgi:hypothetical protein
VFSGSFGKIEALPEVGLQFVNIFDISGPDIAKLKRTVVGIFPLHNGIDAAVEKLLVDVAGLKVTLLAIGV